MFAMIESILMSYDPNSTTWPDAFFPLAPSARRIEHFLQSSNHHVHLFQRIVVYEAHTYNSICYILGDHAHQAVSVEVSIPNPNLPC